MGATFPRLKTWTEEILSDVNLNAEIDNILDNLTPSGMDDYSSNATQMKIQTNPGDLNSESLATSLAGELERLRFVIQRLLGPDTTYWYEAPPTTLTDVVDALGSGLPRFRIVSGRTTGNSSQLCALIPTGTSAQVILSASNTPFSYFIDGTQYSISANVTLSSLALAPSTSNTCSISNANWSGNQSYTKSAGQFGSTFVTTANEVEITDLAGKLAAFKVGTEYFLAQIPSNAASASTTMSNTWRGCFFDSSASHIPAVVINTSATMTLMQLTYIFANTSQALVTTNNKPTVAGTAPSSPFTGDYWFDLSTTIWKTFNSAEWVTANATLIGMSVQNETSCVAARTFDPYKATTGKNSLTFAVPSTSTVQAKEFHGAVDVFGTYLKFEHTRTTWDMASHLDTGVTEAASTLYYLYLKENGDPVISDSPPTKRPNILGLYHAGELWRCVGKADNDASSNLTAPVYPLNEGLSNSVLFPDFRVFALPFTNNTQKTTTLPTYLSHSYFSTFTNTPIVIPSNANSSQTDILTISLSQGLWQFSLYMEALNSVTASESTISVLNFSVGNQTGNQGTFTEDRNIIMSLPSGPGTNKRNSGSNTMLFHAPLPQTPVYLKCTITAGNSTAFSATYNIFAKKLTPYIGEPT